MFPDLPGRGKTSGSGRLGRMCALRSAAFRKEWCRPREIPPRRRLIRTGCPRNLPESGRRSGSGRPGRMCALCSAAFRKERRRLREIPPRRRLIRTGCPRIFPESWRRSGSGGRRRVRKTAGSRKIDENLIFGTRAFVFYPLSLAAPKILRLNKIANKFAFVSGLFVSLRLKPKYANKP